MRHAAQRAVRQERQPELRAQLDLGQGAPERRRELVLHRHEPVTEDRVGGGDLAGVGVGDAGRRDQPLVEELAQAAHRLGVRHLRVRPVVLVQVDLLDLQPSHRGQAGLAEVLRPPVELPVAAPAGVAALGGHEDLVAPEPVQRLGDQQLVVAEGDLVGRVGVRGVDQRDAFLESPADGGQRLLLVVVLAHRHGHRAQAEGADGPLTDASLLHRARLGVPGVADDGPGRGGA
jgi:hypothetical protein